MRRVFHRGVQDIRMTANMRELEQKFHILTSFSIALKQRLTHRLTEVQTSKQSLLSSHHERVFIFFVCISLIYLFSIQSMYSGCSSARTER
jgi:hypothetical protein